MSRPRTIAGSQYWSNKAYCRTLDEATRAWCVGKSNHLKSDGRFYTRSASPSSEAKPAKVFPCVMNGHDRKCRI